MKLREVIIIPLLILPFFSFAQIELEEHTLYGCSFIILPEIEGTGLSSDLYYYQGALSDNQIYYPGDTVFLSTGLFAYDAINGWEECLTTVILEREPIFEMEDTVWYCNLGVLPKPTGEYLTINATYFTTNDYSGDGLYPGQTIDQSGWYFLRDGYEDCFVYDSIYIGISQPIYIDELTDTLVCLEYIVPDLSSKTNGDKIRLHDDLGNTYAIGDVITENTNLHLISSNNACSFSKEFRVRVFDGIFDDIKDTTHCDNTQFNNPLNRYHFLPGFSDSYIRVLNNDFSVTYIIDYQLDNTACSFQHSFTVVNAYKNNPFPRCMSDTSYLCNTGEINMNQYVRYYETLQSETNLQFFNTAGDPVGSTFNTQDIIGSPMEIFIHGITVPECFDSTQIFKTVFIVKEDCNIQDFNDTIRCAVPIGWSKDVKLRLPYRTKLYDHEFELLNQSKFASYIEVGSNTFYHVLEYYDGSLDTSTHHIEYIENLETYPIQTDFGSICFGDCIELEYEYINPQDTIGDFVVWEMDLFSVQGDQFIETVYAFNDFLTICFDQSLDEPVRNIHTVELENHEYYIVEGELVQNGFCIKNDVVDTIYFNTLFNNSRFIEDNLCPDEEVVINQDTFNIFNPSGKVLIENATANGCDSIIEVNLEYAIPSIRYINEIYCDTNQIIAIGCEIFDHMNTSGTVIFENASASGCDSIIEIELIYSTLEIISEVITFCEGDTINHFGIPIYQNVTLFDTISNQFGCDSIVEINEFIMQDSPMPIPYEIEFNCDSQSYDLAINESYPILLIDNSAITNDQISNITESNLTIQYGFNQSCLNNELIELSFPDDWNIYLENFVEAQRTEEVILSFDTELASPIITWSPTEILSCTECPSPTLLINQSTTVFLQLTDELGCSKTDTIVINFTDNNIISIPNVISQSSILDKNGSFHVISTRDVIYDMVIYDRWGSQIYKATDILSNDLSSGWIPSKKYTSGIYVYLIDFHDPDIEPRYG
ncbi:MAG: hypothetical protein AAGA77_22035, partial [Bacteroidota bacterium]